MVALFTFALVALSFAVDVAVSDNVTYVGMSASVLVQPLRFEASTFALDVATNIGVLPSRVVVVTYDPSSNASLTIVDFVILDAVDPPSAATAAALLISSPPSLEHYTVTNIIVDSTVAYVGADSVGPKSFYSIAGFTARNPGMLPLVVMFVACGLWIIFLVWFSFDHWKRERLRTDAYYDPGSMQAKRSFLVDEKLRPEGAPSCVALDHNIVQVACSAHHVLLLTDTNCLFVWGSNVWGQLGLGYTSPFVSASTGAGSTDEETLMRGNTRGPRLFHRDFDSSDFSAADAVVEKVCAYVSESKLTASGGALRSHAVRSYWFEDHCILDVDCGTLHSAILTNKGLFVCGSNAYGQLGIGDPSESAIRRSGGRRFSVFGTNENCSDKEKVILTASAPMPVEYFQDAQQTGVLCHVRCGSYHTAVLTTKGVYLFGCGLDHQLFNATASRACFTPTLVDVIRLKKDLGLPVEGLDCSVVRVSCMASLTLLVLDDGCVVASSGGPVRGGRSLSCLATAGGRIVCEGSGGVLVATPDGDVTLLVTTAGTSHAHMIRMRCGSSSLACRIPVGCVGQRIFTCSCVEGRNEIETIDVGTLATQVASLNLSRTSEVRLIVLPDGDGILLT